MKALSIKPPWAYYTVYGVPFGVSEDNADGSTSVVDSGKVILKDVENRSWPLPPSFVVPQRVYVHVGTREDRIEHVLALAAKIGLPFFSIMSSYSKRLPRGALIGQVTITGCVKDSKSPWAAAGQYHFTLADPEPLAKPIRYRGRLGFFDVAV